MKRKISYFPAITAVIAFSFLLTTIGCKKSSSGPSAGLSGSFSGTAFQPSLVLGVDQAGYLNVVGIQKKGSDSIGVFISLPDNSAINTGVSFADAGIEYDDSQGTFDFNSGNTPSHGIVTITSFDKTNLKVAGTFSGVIYDTHNDSVVITNGQFNTPYKQY